MVFRTQCPCGTHSNKYRRPERTPTWATIMSHRFMGRPVDDTTNTKSQSHEETICKAVMRTYEPSSTSECLACGKFPSEHFKMHGEEPWARRFDQKDSKNSCGQSDVHRFMYCNVSKDCPSSQSAMWNVVYDDWTRRNTSTCKECNQTREDHFSNNGRTEFHCFVQFHCCVCWKTMYPFWNYTTNACSN